MTDLERTEMRQVEEELRRQVAENSRRTHELETLTDLFASMRRAQNRTEMIPLLVQRSAQALGARTAALGLLEGNRLVFISAMALEDGSLPGDLPVDPDHLVGARLAFGDDPLWGILGHGEVVYLADLCGIDMPAAGSFFAGLTSGLCSAAAAPLKAGRTTVGLLFLGYAGRQDFTPEKKRLVEAIADMAGNALHRMNVTETLETLLLDRTRDLQTIYQVTSAASESQDLHIALQCALDQSIQAFHAAGGLIFLLSESGQQVDLVADYGVPPEVRARLAHQPLDLTSLEGEVILTNQAMIILDMAADPRTQRRTAPGMTLTSVPMRVHERVTGVVDLIGKERQQLNLEELTLLSFIADHLGLVVDHFRLRQQAEKIAVMQERSRLARELHDSVTQSLYSASLFVDAGQRYGEQGNLEKTLTYLDRLGAITQQALKEMRLLVYDLRSPELAAGSLGDAIRKRLDGVERRSGVQTTLVLSGGIHFPAEVEEALYGILLEALNNTLKHAGADRVSISLTSSRDAVLLSIQDNGRGFDLANIARRGGLGLAGMRERAERLGGSLQIDTTPGMGARLSATIPIPEKGGEA